MAVKLLWNMIQSLSGVVRTMNNDLPLPSAANDDVSGGVEHPYRNG